MKVFISLFLFISASAYAQFDCSNLVGGWKSQNFEYNISAQRNNTVIFEEDKTWVMSIIYTDQHGKSAQSEVGKWDCDGTHFQTKIEFINGAPVDVTHKYKIHVLDNSYTKFEGIDIKCEDIISDCENTTYELYKYKSQTGIK